MTLLFHASDLHFGAEDSAALAWFAQAVTDEQPDAVIITGDLTMRARSAEFAAAQKEASDLVYQAKQAADAQIQQVKAETAIEIAKIKAEAKKMAEELRKQ